MPNTPKVNRDAGFEKPAKVKRVTSPPPGAGPIRPVKVTGRDPRAGFRGARTRNPNRAYG